MRRSDIPALSILWTLAFSPTEFHAALFPDRYTHPGHYHAFAVRLIRTRFADPLSRYTVAVHTDPATGAQSPVGLGCFQAAGALTHALAKRWHREAAWGTRAEQALLAVENAYWRRIGRGGGNWTAIDGFWAQVHTLYRDVPVHLHCPTIAIHPEHQKRGIGAMLVRHGIGLSESESLPITLEATENGRGLYEKFGFRQFTTVQLGVEEGKVVQVPVMLWEPERCKGRWLIQNGQDGWQLRPRVDQDL